MDYNRVDPTLQIPVLPDGTVIVVPGLFYRTVGIQFDLLDKFLQVERTQPKVRLRVDLGREAFDPPIEGFWARRVEIIDKDLAVSYFTWMGRQAFCCDSNEDDVWVIVPQAGLLYQMPCLILFPSGIGLGYTQGVAAATNGPIRYERTLGDLTLKLRFEKNRRHASAEPPLPPAR